jgi:hypothetical protein
MVTDRCVKALLVTGMHRSGTTFVGKILSEAPGTVSLHEPFNKDFGIRGVASVYPAVLDDCLRNQVRQVLSLNFNVVRNAPNDPFFKSIARWVLGGRTNIDKYKAKWQLFKDNDVKTLVIKDPFLMLNCCQLANEYDISSVITLRHPVAIWRSIRRMNWIFDFELFANENITKKYSFLTRQKINSLSEVEKFSYLYLILYSSALEASRDSHMVHLVRHEDICVKPVENFSEIASKLNIYFSNSMIKLVHQTTSSDKAEYDNNKLHNFERDSKALAWAWCDSECSEDENMIKGICGDLVVDLYGFWRPSSCL